MTWHSLPDREAEAQTVVELVRNAEGRAAILVRSRESLADIVPALKSAGIRFRAIEIEHLGEKQVVQDLYALTRALLHLGDRIAWLSLLRAPWCGLSLHELHQIAGRDRFATIWELIKDDLFLERFTRILAPAIANHERGSLRERVEGVWLALGGPACVESQTDLEDAEIFLDELDKLEASGAIADPAALREALERLYALPDVDATDESLQIMTIHKAKGLEFGTVIVPGLDKSPATGDPPLFLWKETVGAAFDPPVKGGSELTRAGGLLLAPIKPAGADKDPIYAYLRDLDAEAEDMEASRLLYVAATRAEHRLHLLGCVKCEEDGTPKRPTSRSLLARAWPVAEEFFRTPTPPAREREAPAPAPITTLTRLAPDFQMPTLPTPIRWTPPPEGREEEQIEFSWAGETARHVGTVVHRWLQRIADDELRGWDAKRVDSLKENFARELERRGVTPAELKVSTELVVMALKNSLADERGRWVLGAHPEARSEYRMRLRTPEGTRTLAMDRVFRESDGTRWIIDYKTSRHEGTGVHAFLDRELDRYAEQLRLYSAVLKQSQQALYFPLHQGWRVRKREDRS